MLIQKGGITRSIDNNRLHEYKAKGYVPAATVQAASAAPKGNKQPKKDEVKDEAKDEVKDEVKDEAKDEVKE